MIGSNIINWIELGDSMQKLDVYGIKENDNFILFPQNFDDM